MVKRILVIGAGIMGRGIAQVAAQTGFRVFLNDADKTVLDKSLGLIEGPLSKRVQAGKMSSEEKDKIMANIAVLPTLEDNLKDLDVDLVIEAVVEDYQVKAELFRRIDNLLPSSTIFASNTSSISITKLAATTHRPERFIGMHFFNPVPVMKLLEIIRGIRTSDETYETAKAVGQALGKTCILAPDTPGFLVNRILLPLLNEAFFAVMEGAKPEDVDAGMKLGCNHPMGPLELADFSGLDTTLHVLEVMYAEFGDPKYRPCPLLKRMVAGGLLGRKSGRGFYQY